MASLRARSKDFVALELKVVAPHAMSVSSSAIRFVAFDNLRQIADL